MPQAQANKQFNSKTVLLNKKNKKKKLPWNTHDNSRSIGSLVNDAPIVGRCPKQALL